MSVTDRDSAIFAAMMVQQKTKDRPCPICEERDWRIEVFTEGEHATPAIGAIGTANRPGGVPVVMLTCGNCGFVRLHNAAYLQTLVQKSETK